MQTKPKEPVLHKGFVDIIEYHTTTLRGREVELMPTDRFVPGRNKGKKTQTYGDYAVVLRRTWTQQRDISVLVRVELEIQSEELCKVFKNIAVHSYEDSNLVSFPIKLRSPFSELFFYRDKIKEFAEDENNGQKIRQEAKELYDFTQKNGLMRGINEDYERYSKEGRVVNDILWTIYPPNSLIVVNVGTVRECWICRNVITKYNEMTGRYYWEVTGFRIGFDGSSPGLTRQTSSIPATGMQLMKITDLPLIPVEYFQDWESLKATLIRRSIKLQSILGQDFTSFKAQNYTGPAWVQDEEDLRRGRRQWVRTNQVIPNIVHLAAP